MTGLYTIRSFLKLSCSCRILVSICSGYVWGRFSISNQKRSRFRNFRCLKERYKLMQKFVSLNCASSDARTWCFSRALESAQMESSLKCRDALFYFWTSDETLNQHIGAYSSSNVGIKTMNSAAYTDTRTWEVDKITRPRFSLAHGRRVQSFQSCAPCFCL